MIERHDFTLAGKAAFHVRADLSCGRLSFGAGAQEKGEHESEKGFHRETYEVARALQDRHERARAVCRIIAKRAT